MEIENEIKFKIDKSNKSIEKEIVKFGFKFKKEKFQDDYYFSPPHKKFAGTKKYYLRLRKKEDNVAVFAYHVVVDNLQTKELEVNCNSFTNLKLILKKLDFNLDCVVKKHRKVFIDEKNDNFQLVLDKVTGLGTFIEIEYIGKMTKNVSNMFQELINYLGLKKNQVISGCGYPDLLMKKNKI
jgi:predicted adenylyl cyclase CyaB